MATDLSGYNNDWYRPGNPLKRICWYYVNSIFFKTGLFPFYGLKRFFLRLFGATIGTGVCIKPYVNIKYPWKLTIGNHVWIGEEAWIDNIGEVTIGNHVCLSQGAYLLTGNHDYKKVGFDLIVKPISLEDGVWIGAKAIVCPGINCLTHSVLTAGSVATTNLEAWCIYQGNPAEKIKERVMI
jgi:putative colanic acid biosynthesis acetyltransferase WcaF